MRLACWSTRHRALVVAGWFALTIGLFVLSQALGGIRAVSVTDPGERSLTESGRAAAAMSGGSPASADERLDVVIGSPGVDATDPAFRSAVARVLDRLRGVTAVVDGSPRLAVAGLVDPYGAPPAAGLVAADLRAVRLSGTIAGDAPEVAAKTAALAPVLAALRDEMPGFEVHAIATTLLSEQMADEINRDLDGALAITLPATLLILFLAFGALVAACVPLVLAITALLGAFGIVGIFSRVVEPVSPYATQVIVLIGLAVAVDYSLFMISRFRSERRAGRDRLEAVEAASATAGRAVVFSGFAVMVSLGGLFLVPVSVFQSMAVGTIAVVLVSVAGSLVFIPAVLAALGDGVNRGSLRILSFGNGSGRGWGRLVDAVMAHPIASAIAATAVLVLIASPVTRLRLGEPDVTSLPASVDGVRAVEQLRAHWPQGTLVTLDAVVTGPGASRDATVRRLAAELEALSGLTGPARVTPSADGSATSVSLLMAGASNDPRNWQIVRDVRSGQAAEAATGNPGAAVLVGGAAATSMDQTTLFGDGMARIAVFVLALSFLLLLLVFHSIAIPVKAIALNLLATGAAFGALVLVFQEGWFAEQLGIRPTEVTNFVPIFVFTTLFGLSMDYEVFILARVKEAFDRGADSHEAVALGISRTAGTVTSAAAIMVVVFAVFLTLPLAIARQMGLGLAVAVLVDATLIRTILLPATMRLLGDWNWWMPPLLRRLPTIRIEGEAAPRGPRLAAAAVRHAASTDGCAAHSAARAAGRTASTDGSTARSAAPGVPGTSNPVADGSGLAGEAVR